VNLFSLRPRAIFQLQLLVRFITKMAITAAQCFGMRGESAVGNETLRDVVLDEALRVRGCSIFLNESGVSLRNAH